MTITLYNITLIILLILRQCPLSKVPFRAGLFSGSGTKSSLQPFLPMSYGRNCRYFASSNRSFASCHCDAFSQQVMLLLKPLPKPSRKKQAMRYQRILKVAVIQPLKTNIVSQQGCLEDFPFLLAILHGASCYTSGLYTFCTIIEVEHSHGAGHQGREAVQFHSSWRHAKGISCTQYAADVTYLK